jgi:glyoxylase I family protein
MEHAALFANDVKALKDFYVDVMGLRIVLDNSAAPTPGFFLADDGDMMLELIGRPEGVEVGDTRYLCHIAFTVADLDAEQKRLEALGFVFETDSVVDNASMKTVFFRDPANNRCQIISRARPLIG